jgi:GNAT superfamily N-acetyltransferase
VKVVVRPAEPVELDVVGAQTLEAYAEYQSSFPPEYWTDYTVELADARRRAESGTVFVATVDGKPIGSATVHWDTAEPETLYLKMVAVVPAGRGAGAGPAIMDAVFEHARAEGARVLKWNTVSFMTAARKLYSRLGYEPEQADVLGEDFTLFTYRARIEESGSAAGRPQ